MLKHNQCFYTAANVKEDNVIVSSNVPTNVNGQFTFANS